MNTQTVTDRANSIYLSHSKLILLGFTVANVNYLALIIDHLYFQIYFKIIVYYLPYYVVYIVVVVVDADHPQSMATPYPTPLPIDPEDYIIATTAIDPGVTDNVTEVTALSHHPVGRQTEYRPEPVTMVAMGGGKPSQGQGNRMGEVNGGTVTHRPAAPVYVDEGREYPLGLNLVEIICKCPHALLVI